MSRNKHKMMYYRPDPDNPGQSIPIPRARWFILRMMFGSMLEANPRPILNIADVFNANDTHLAAHLLADCERKNEAEYKTRLSQIHKENQKWGSMSFWITPKGIEILPNG